MAQEKKSNNEPWRIIGNKRIYSLNETCAQYKLFQKIECRNFLEKPGGLYSNGFGLTMGGFRFVSELFQRISGNKKLIIDYLKKSEITKEKNKNSYVILLNYKDLVSLNKEYSRVNKIKNNEFKNFSVKKITEIFPKNQFIKKHIFKKDNYVADTLYGILKSKNFSISALSSSDAEALVELLPKLFESNSFGSLYSETKFIATLQNKTKKVFLEKVVAEFKKKLSKKKHNENDWQKFLGQHLLLFNPSYEKRLEKNNISVDNKYPDFILVDSFDYADIFEIKKPDTPLFKYDEGRDNYYWSDELSKAISQTENYIHKILNTTLDFKESIKEKEKISINIIRPRGFIIVGNSKQLEDDKKIKSFRILNDSLKNLQIILFDDLLKKLESFIRKLN
jgi:hypothetical protein